MNIKGFQSDEYWQHYQSFLPSRMNHAWTLNDGDLLWLLSQADRKLGELNAFSQLLPDVDFFIRMHVSKEATTSSHIERTQTNIEDALQKIENIAPEKRGDWEEVQNYVKAMNEAIAGRRDTEVMIQLLRSRIAVMTT